MVQGGLRTSGDVGDILGMLGTHLEVGDMKAGEGKGGSKEFGDILEGWGHPMVGVSVTSWREGGAVRWRRSPGRRRGRGRGRATPAPRCAAGCGGRWRPSGAGRRPRAAVGPPH